MILETIWKNLVTPAFSPAFHYIFFALKKQTSRFENGMFITSIDVDVGNEKLGVINKGRYDRDVSDHDSERLVGEIEERNLPLLLHLLEDLEIPVTFAFRGQLLDVDASFPKLVMRSSIRPEIASHGYFHRAFTGLSQKEADEELKMTMTAMTKLGVTPRSFIFPRNKVAHLDLLKKYGYVCYRGPGSLTRDDMRIRKECDELYDIHPSVFLGHLNDSSFLERTVDLCEERRLPFHVWFHPRDIGETEKQAEKRIRRMLSPLLRHAKKREREGTLTFETMLSATNKAKVTLEEVTCVHERGLDQDCAPRSMN